MEFARTSFGQVTEHRLGGGGSSLGRTLFHTVCSRCLRLLSRLVAALPLLITVCHSPLSLLGSLLRHCFLFNPSFSQCLFLFRPLLSRIQKSCIDHCHLQCVLHNRSLLPTEQETQKHKRVSFWGHDPITHVRRARYLTVHVGEPSLSVSLSLSLSFVCVSRQPTCHPTKSPAEVGGPFCLHAIGSGLESSVVVTR